MVKLAKWYVCYIFNQLENNRKNLNKNFLFVVKRIVMCDIVFNELLYQHRYLAMRVRNENKLQKIMGYVGRA